MNEDETNPVPKLDPANENSTSHPILEQLARFTITLGTYGTKENMLKSITDKGHKVSDYALRVINNDQFLMLGAPEEEYEFFEMKVNELTERKNPTTTELYEAMYYLGFIDAPHESAPAIREIYDNQPMDEWRAVLSKPVEDSGGSLNVLNVGRDSGGSWVNGSSAGPGNQWSGGIQLLVCRKRQTTA